MRLAIREGMAPGASLPERLDWLARVGLDGIELHDAETLSLPARDIRRIVEAADARVSAIEGSSLLLSPDPAERAVAVNLFRRRIALAAELGAVGVLVVPQFGRRPALPDLAPLRSAADLERDLLLAQLRDISPAAEAAGVALFLEPLNRYEAWLVNRVGQGAAVAREVGPAVGVMADFFHMCIEEADFPTAITENADRLVYVHVADSNRLQPGAGHLDFRPGFAALRGIGYDGWLTIECRIDGPYDATVRTSAAHLRELWAAAG